MNEYRYIGDRHTSDQFKGRRCFAIHRKNGKCVRGKNGNMLVIFEGTVVVVQARLLRKLRTLDYSPPIQEKTEVK